MIILNEHNYDFVYLFSLVKHIYFSLIRFLFCNLAASYGISFLNFVNLLPPPLYRTPIKDTFVLLLRVFLVSGSSEIYIFLINFSPINLTSIIIYY